MQKPGEIKKAIIVGATSGIGNQLARLLAKDNYLVGITGRRNHLLENLVESKPDNFIIKAFDCSQNNSIELLDDLVTQLGGLDLLVISAGTGEFNHQLDFAIDQPTIELNVVAFTKMVNWGYRYFEKQNHGHLVGITSIGGLRGSRMAPVYHASKAYQLHFLEGLQQKVHHAKLNFTITDIRPGLVDTDMAKGDGLFWVAPLEKATKQIYRIIKNKRRKGYVTKRWALIAYLFKLLPHGLYKNI